MSTLVRNSGLNAANNVYDVRNAFNLSDGSAVLVVYDTNTASGLGGDKTGVTKIYVYHSTDRINWTLRATLSPPVNGKISCNVSDLNVIGIVLYGTDRTVRFASVSATWVASSWVTVQSALTSTQSQNWYDLTWTPGGIPVIIALRRDTSGSTRLRVYSHVRNSSNTWVTTALTTLQASVTPKTAWLTATCLALGGGSTTARPLVYAVGNGTATDDGGVELWTALVNETTGAVTGMTKRATHATNNVPANSTAVNSRQAMLFLSDDSGYALGLQHWEARKRIGATRGTWDGTTWAVTHAYTSYPVDEAIWAKQYAMTMTYSSGILQYVYATVGGHLAHWLAKFDEEGADITFNVRHWLDNQSRHDSITPMGGTGPHTEYATHDVLFLRWRSATEQDYFHIYAKPVRAPYGVAPGNLSTVSTSTPAVRARADLDVQYPQTDIKMRWEFASDSAFTTNLTVYHQDDDKFKLVANTHQSGASVPFSDVLPDELLLPQGSWYVRAAQVTEFEVVGDYSPTNAFTISHPPVPAKLIPSDTEIIQYTGTVQLSWVFSDTSLTDRQTAFQVIVQRNSTGSTILDSGKVISFNSIYNATIPSAEKGNLLQWSVRLWDNDDVVGEYSEPALFITSDPPTFTFTSPTNNQVLTTAIPNISGTITVPGERAVKHYQIVIRKSGVKVLDTKMVPVTLYNGQTLSYQPPPELLENSSSYAIHVYLVDDKGLMGGPYSVNVTTAWTPPATASSLVVDTAPYNTEGQGWVEVTWSDSNRDADFTAWVVYAKYDLIDPATMEVLEAGTWTEIMSVTSIASSYSYRDYLAPSGYSCSYRVEQRVIKFGDVVESTNGTVTTVIPVSNSYWVIEPADLEAFQLGSVTSDSYTEEYEEEEFYVIGRGNHVDQGGRIGYKGTLTAQIRDSSAASARQRKVRLEQLKREHRTLYLRTPFGDMFRVAVQSMQISRIAGVGQSEFVDVTIPYVEVSD